MIEDELRRRRRHLIWMGVAIVVLSGLLAVWQVILGSWPLVALDVFCTIVGAYILTFWLRHPIP